MSDQGQSRRFRDVRDESVMRSIAAIILERRERRDVPKQTNPLRWMDRKTLS